jgi:preprotein translocase subunit SecA
MLAEDMLDGAVATFAPREGDLEAWDLDALKRETSRIFAVDTATLDFSDQTSDEIRDLLWERIEKSYKDKEDLVGREVLQRVERDIMLQVVDGQWKDHLYSLDHLKEGIGLRGYGQRDPLVEYKKESFELFQAMKDRVDEEIVRYMWWLRPVLSDEGGGAVAAPRRPAPRRAPLVLNSPSTEANPAFAAAKPQPAFAGAAAPAPGRAQTPARVGGDDAAVKTIRRDEPKVGRNDPCPCGSGKKYKKCHGATA